MAGKPKNQQSNQQANKPKVDKVVNLSPAEQGMMFGNMDDENEFEFDAKSADHFVVRQSRMEKLGSGAVVEDPKSIGYQFYDEQNFRRLSKEDDEKKSPFTEQGLTIKVLHDPTKVKAKTAAPTEIDAAANAAAKQAEIDAAANAAAEATKTE